MNIMPTSEEQCPHLDLQLEPSPYAAEAGFEWQPLCRRLAATTKSGRRAPSAGSRRKAENDIPAQSAIGEPALSYPAPLVLPNDDLACDPKCPPQSFRSWLYEKARNKPKEDRRTLYVAAVPEITSSMAFMRDWLQPDTASGRSSGGGLKQKPPGNKTLPSPSYEDIVSYLSTFYRGLPLKPFPQRLRFVPWEETRMKKPNIHSTYVGLATRDSCTRIRVRSPPDGVFKGQLNLGDILDAAIEMLPGDAYSLLLLLDHDMYEDEDDDFCCGRAYGGSRVAVVSSSRYHPILDEQVGIEYSHMWPASHCKSYINGLCTVDKPKEQSGDPWATSFIPLRAAIDAAKDIIVPTSQEGLRALWFSRLARTASHELGHCFGMEHCVYYACNMQSTAGMAEDVRQPPYLCPICLSKFSYAVACELQGHDDTGRQLYIQERYGAIITFCDGWKGNGLFTGYGAWARARLDLLQQT
ncbi:hypothetical protein DL764_008218 [Monosporascus ibericus]|uniref:Archaemetzincin-2 n=1 Tax=Monosporascus ibericus TaxID=155417 RepID=A0A4Q4T0W0_9PEZI|nr:hypothetical protein DL764_008218 [Monosporascus ibericus]